MKSQPATSMARKPSQTLQSMLSTAQIFALIRHTKPAVEASNVLQRHIIRFDAIEPHTIISLFFPGANEGYDKKYQSLSDKKNYIFGNKMDSGKA
jgi:hypothetical protein